MYVVFIAKQTNGIYCDKLWLPPQLSYSIILLLLTWANKERVNYEQDVLKQYTFQISSEQLD